MNVTISDFGGMGAGSGNIASRLLANNMNPDCLSPFVEMRTNEQGQLVYGPDGLPIVQGNYMTINGVNRPVANATLRKEEWLQFDTKALEIQRQRLVGVADLNSRGLTYNIANGLGTTVLESQKQSGFGAAEMTMTGRSRAKADTPVWTSDYLPLPLIHAGFDVDIRHLNSSRRLGNSLDMTAASEQAYNIAVFLEDLLFNGVSGNFSYGGGNIYGYRTHPSRIQYTITDWATATPTTIKTHVLGMIQAAKDLYFPGPFMLYVPTAYSTALDDDYHSGATGWHGGKTVRERLLQIEGISGIRTSDSLNSTSVILVQMTESVVRMVNGLPLRTVEWSSEGGMVSHYKYMTIQIPQIRADANGSCGVVHGSV